MSFDFVPCYAIRCVDLFAVATRLPYPMTKVFEKRRYMQRCGTTEFYLLYRMFSSAPSHIRMTKPIRQCNKSICYHVDISSTDLSLVLP